MENTDLKRPNTRNPCFFVLLRDELRQRNVGRMNLPGAGGHQAACVIDGSSGIRAGCLSVELCESRDLFLIVVSHVV